MVLTTELMLKCLKWSLLLVTHRSYRRPVCTMEISTHEGKNTSPQPFSHSKQDPCVYLLAALVACLWGTAVAVGMLLPSRVSSQLTSLVAESLTVALQACGTFTILRWFCSVSALCYFHGSSLTPSLAFKIFVEIAKVSPAWDSSTYWLQQN